MQVKVAQLGPTLCNLMGCSPPGPSVHGILQASILKWVAILFSRASSQPKDQSQVSCIAGRFFTIWTSSEAPSSELVWTNSCGKVRFQEIKINTNSLDVCVWNLLLPLPSIGQNNPTSEGGEINSTSWCKDLQKVTLQRRIDTESKRIGANICKCSMALSCLGFLVFLESKDWIISLS